MMPRLLVLVMLCCSAALLLLLLSQTDLYMAVQVGFSDKCIQWTPSTCETDNFLSRD
jgi:hypothetical protein